MQRMTFSAACVLQALDNGEIYGFSIMDATGLASGTVYQILRRFERDGLVRSAWETPQSLGDEPRPRRRYYRLTREGRKVLARAAERYRERPVLFGQPARPTNPSP